MNLEQSELKVIVGILQQVQLVYKDSLVVNQIIQKLDSYIEKPKPSTVPLIPVEVTPTSEDVPPFIEGLESFKTPTKGDKN